MHKFQALLKPYLRDILLIFRRNTNWTQEQTAAQLHISPRSFSDLERGKSGFSAVTLILFLSLLSDEKILKVVHGFQSLLDKAEKKEAA